MTSISGWIALALFILSFFLALRLPSVNRVFGGLQQQLRWHHRVALLSMGAMLWHLFQLLWSYGSAFPMLFNLKELSLFMGWVALAAAIFAGSFAFLRSSMTYRRWRMIHLVTCLSLLAALLHTYFVLQPQILSEWSLFLFTVGLGLLALLLLVVLPKAGFWGKGYQISTQSEVRPGLFLLELQVNENVSPLSYLPGHFIYVKFLDPAFTRIWHPFTIVSSPARSELELLIKARGQDTNKLRNLKVPSPLRVLGPFGSPFWKKDESQLWVSYGVGAAIFLAAIRTFPALFKSRVHYICCESAEDNVFFQDELRKLAEVNPQFTWELFIGSGQQFVGTFRLENILSRDLALIRICGHPGFQQSLKSILISGGVPRDIIHLEGLL